MSNLKKMLDMSILTMLSMSYKRGVMVLTYRNRTVYLTLHDRLFLVTQYLTEPSVIAYVAEEINS